jgi:aspartyl-tRNA(Asn)/glutamyl-tRNA(Gln) amidotransferase subunit B
MRSKEGSEDYRYFPEPDLVPVAPTEAMRAEAARAVPELPAAQRARFVGEWGLTPSDARVLVDNPALAEYAEHAVVAGGSPRDVANWCTGDILGYVNETGTAVGALLLTPDGLAELVALVRDGTLSRNLAKEVLAECLRDGKRPREVVDARGLAQVSDEGELAGLIDDVLGRNSDAVAEYRDGDDKAKKKKRGFLMGELMKASKGKGNPQLLNKLLDERLQAG